MSSHDLFDQLHELWVNRKLYLADGLLVGGTWTALELNVLLGWQKVAIGALSIVLMCVRIVSAVQQMRKGKGNV